MCLRLYLAYDNFVVRHMDVSHLYRCSNIQHSVNTEQLTIVTLGYAAAHFVFWCVM